MKKIHITNQCFDNHNVGEKVPEMNKWEVKNNLRGYQIDDLLMRSNIETFRIYKSKND